MVNRAHTSSKPERLIYWYLRLNGFLLLENFVIHPEKGHLQLTEADLFGIRFKNRQELPNNPMKDDPVVSDCPTLCNVIIAEVKSSDCRLNRPLTKNIHPILSAIGCLPKDKTDAAAEALCNKGRYQGDCVTCRLFAFGDREGKICIPVPQILFDNVIKFIHGRFIEYSKQKSNIGNWAPDGRYLGQLASRCPDLQDFNEKVREYFCLPKSKAEERT